MIITTKFLNKNLFILLFFLLLILGPKSGFGETVIDSIDVSVTLTIIPDDDLDTISDDWELDFFGDLNQAHRGEPPSDFDNDGFPDFVEYYIGSHPKDSRSGLNIVSSLFDGNGHFLLTWLSTASTNPGPRAYDIYRADSVFDLLNQTGTIQLIEKDFPSQGAITIYSDTDVSGDSQKFYQVILSSPVIPYKPANK